MLRVVVLAIAAPALAAAQSPQPGLPTSADPPRYAITGFGGVMVDNTWHEVFTTPGDLEFEESSLVGVALSARLAEPLDGLTLEIEGQVVRHFGDQTHWEFNAPIGVARWGRFPWSNTLHTSAAFGLGLSVASETPQLEKRTEGGSQPVMAHWFIEVELGRPHSDWSVIGRLHHRSTAFGLFGDDGGSDALGIGLRRRF